MCGVGYRCFETEIADKSKSDRTIKDENQESADELLWRHTRDTFKMLLIHCKFRMVPAKFQTYPPPPKVSVLLFAVRLQKWAGQ